MIFIDTAAFLARFIREDPYHDEAIHYWNELSRSKENCITSNFVLNETLTLLGRRAGYNFAAQRAYSFYASKELLVMRPTQEDELKAVEFFEKYSDQRVSFTDCISFVLMRNKKISKVFTFDRHFEHAGFRLRP